MSPNLISTKKIFSIIFFLIVSVNLTAQQTELEKMTSDNAKPLAKHEKVKYTFKSATIGIGRSNETQAKHNLNVVITHRFGDIAGEFGSFKTFFGMDNATDVKIGFDYGITNRLTVGVARTKGNVTVKNLYELGLKYRLIEQTVDNHVPLSVTLYGNTIASAVKKALDAGSPSFYENFSERLSYLAEAIIARKFSNRLSLAVTPAYVHYNRVINGDMNSLFALGFGGRWKVTKRGAIIGDYFYSFRNKSSIAEFKRRGAKQYNALTVGYEFETGGHVFGLIVTNARSIPENQFLTYNSATWKEGQYRLGFTINRNFVVGKKHKKSW
jgi:hypothetical protein